MSVVPGTQRASDQTRRAWDLTHAGRYAKLTDLLGSLVPDLETAARALPEEQRTEVFELMAATYRRARRRWRNSASPRPPGSRLTAP